MPNGDGGDLVLHRTGVCINVNNCHDRTMGQLTDAQGANMWSAGGSFTRPLPAVIQAALIAGADSTAGAAPSRSIKASISKRPDLIIFEHRELERP